MSIIHIDHHLSNFVIIDKGCLDDNGLSWRATGLHSYLMGLPHDWCVNLSDLSNRKTDGRASVRSAIDELESIGYVTKIRTRDAHGKMSGWDYTIYETPIKAGVPTEVRSTDVGLTDVGQMHTTKEPKDTKDTGIVNKIEVFVEIPAPNSSAIEATPNPTQNTPEDAVPPLDPNKGWNGMVMAIWKEHYGLFPPWKLKLVKPLVIEHGKERVRVALEAYITSIKDPQFASINRFVETWNQWDVASKKQEWYNDERRYAKATRQ